METYTMLKKVNNLEMSKIIANFMYGTKKDANRTRNNIKYAMESLGKDAFNAFKFVLQSYESMASNGIKYLFVYDANCKVTNYICDDFERAKILAYNALVKKGMLL